MTRAEVFAQSEPDNSGNRVAYGRAIDNSGAYYMSVLYADGTEENFRPSPDGVGWISLSIGLDAGAPIQWDAEAAVLSAIDMLRRRKRICGHCAGEAIAASRLVLRRCHPEPHIRTNRSKS